MDCIDKILDFYKNQEIYKFNEVKIRLGKILIELMNDLNNPSNLFRVRNCLVLLINLFFDIDYPDHLHKQGKPLCDLSEEELKIVHDLLKSELS
ncbi:MAG: hypothetical protein ACFE8A_11530 [Candidatus Hodarchaeota archaeon]